MLGRTAVRRFCSVKPPSGLTFGLVRWVVLYPWAGLSGVFVYEYFRERDALKKIASEIEMQEQVAASSLPINEYPELPDQTVSLSAEEKEKFRSKCIEAGIAPKHYNDFVKRLEAQQSIREIVREGCAENAGETCDDYLRLGRLLNSQ